MLMCTCGAAVSRIQIVRPDWGSDGAALNYRAFDLAFIRGAVGVPRERSGTMKYGRSLCFPEMEEEKSVALALAAALHPHGDVKASAWKTNVRNI